MHYFLCIVGAVALCHVRLVASRLSEDGNYDFIIVGGGTAGTVLASRLTEIDQWDVLVVEAGGEEPEWSRTPAYWSFAQSTLGNEDWGYRTEPTPESCGGVGCVYPRGRCLGGSSSTNGMYYIRGSRSDYDDWARMGNDGWSYTDVLPYFVRSERNTDPRLVSTSYHGSEGPLSVEYYRYQDANTLALFQALQEFGVPVIDLNGGGMNGTMITQMNTHNGERVSTNTAYLAPARTRPNLHVLTNSHVTKILFNNVTAYGIEYLQDGNKYQAYVSKEVIVCAGTIGSPQILQLSGVGPRRLLQSFGIEVVLDLPVGMRLIDHANAQIVMYRLGNNTVVPNITQVYADYLQYIHTRQGPLTASGPFQLAAFFPPDTSVDSPDLEILFVPIYTGGVIARSYYDVIIPVPVVLQPVSTGYVRINSTDPLQPPLIQPNFLKEEADVQVLLRGINYTLELLNTPTLRNLGYTADTRPIAGCGQYAWGTGAYWRCAVRVGTGTTFHPVATCMMGPHGAPDSVVSTYFEVHGSINLRVIDASVIPRIIRGHTHAATVMVAERGADILKVRWM